MEDPRLNKDLLFSYAIHLDLPDLLSFCSSNKMINEKLCKEDRIWIHKLNEIEEIYKEDIEKLRKETSYGYKKLYELVYSLKKVKDAFKLKDNIYQLHERKRLNLHNNKIKEIPKELGNLSNLQIIDLSDNEIEEIPKEIGKLSKLKELYLYINSIKEIPKEIGKLSNLQYLYLSNNKIKEIPKEIGNLSNLQELYLSNNKIKEIPKEIGNLSNLKELYLGDNKIKKIPKKFKHFPIILK